MVELNGKSLSRIRQRLGGSGGDEPEPESEPEQEPEPEPEPSKESGGSTSSSSSTSSSGGGSQSASPSGASIKRDRASGTGGGGGNGGSAQPTRQAKQQQTEPDPAPEPEADPEPAQPTKQKKQQQSEPDQASETKADTQSAALSGPGATIDTGEDAITQEEAQEIADKGQQEPPKDPATPSESAAAGPSGGTGEPTIDSGTDAITTDEAQDIADKAAEQTGDKEPTSDEPTPSDIEQDAVEAQDGGQPETDTGGDGAPTADDDVGIKTLDDRSQTSKEIEESLENQVSNLTGQDVDLQRGEDFIATRADEGGFVGQLTESAREEFIEPLQRQRAAEKFEQQVEERLGRDVSLDEFDVGQEGEAFVFQPGDELASELQEEAGERLEGFQERVDLSSEIRTAGSFAAARSQAAQAEFEATARELEEQLGTGSERRTAQQRLAEQNQQLEESIEQSVGSARADALGVVDPELRQEVIEETDLEAGKDFRISQQGEQLTLELTEQFEREFEQEQSETIRGQLAAELEAETGADLDPGEDIEFTQEDGQITADLSEAGRKKIAVSGAPIVQAAETAGVGEPQAREIAGQAFEFREFGREQREGRVQPALESLREASGLEGEIEAFEALQEEAGKAEEELLQPAREFVGDRTPGELAAAAAPVAVAEPTPGGELVVGGLLATAAAAETVRRLEPKQQLAVSQAVAAGRDITGTAQRAVGGEVGDVDPATATVPTVEATAQETDRGEMIIDRDVIIDPESGEVRIPDQEKGRVFFPPEQGGELPPSEAPSEIELPIDEAAQRERLGDAITFPQDPPLPIEEDPIFLPEVQVTTDPERAELGRFTGPEVPVDSDEPADTFGGPEIPIEDEELEDTDDFLFPGPEVPTPGEDTGDKFPEPGQTPPVGAAGQQAIQRTPPDVVEDPADVGEDIGPAGPGFVKRKSPRVDEPFIIETPSGQIDLARVRPDLARVLREGPELTAEDPFDATLAGREATGRVDPRTTPGIFGLTEQAEAERLATLDFKDQTQGLGARERLDAAQAPGVRPRLDELQRPGLRTTPAQVPEQVTRTVTTPTTTTPGTTTTPTVTTPEFSTPTVTTPRFGTPTITTTVTPPTTPTRLPPPGIVPEADEPDRRRRDLDEFEKEFVEPIIGAKEFISADDGEPFEANELKKDST